MTTSSTLSVSVLALLAFAILAAASGCAAVAEDPSEPTSEESSALRINPVLGANGDACTVGTSTPGTEKDGECCANNDATNCVVILKPFPKVLSLH